jgi:hypothetical protein
VSFVALKATNRPELTLTAEEYAELTTRGLLYHADWLPEPEGKFPKRISDGKIKKLRHVVRVLQVNGAKLIPKERLDEIAEWLRGAKEVRLDRPSEP